MTELKVRKGDALARAQHAVAGVALAAMMLVVVADVVLRFAFNTPIRGAYDIVSIALLVMVFFGIAPVVSRQGEILIDLIDSFLPERGLRFLRACAALGTLCVFLFLGWSMIGPARDAYRYGDRSLELGLPVWCLWAAAYVGLAGILVVSLRRLRHEVSAQTSSGQGGGGA